MRREPIWTKKKKSSKAERPKRNLQLPRVAFKGTGVYTPPANAPEREREGN